MLNSNTAHLNGECCSQSRQEDAMYRAMYFQGVLQGDGVGTDIESFWIKMDGNESQ